MKNFQIIYLKLLTKSSFQHHFEKLCNQILVALHFEFRNFEENSFKEVKDMDYQNFESRKMVKAINLNPKNFLLVHLKNCTLGAKTLHSIFRYLLLAYLKKH